MISNNVFWITVVLMGLIAVGFVAWPLYKSNRKAVLVGVAVMLPLLAIGTYASLGSPTLESPASHSAPSAMSLPRDEKSTSGKVGSVSSMVDGLAARLEEHPDDGKSWILLARSYEHLGRIAEAKESYQRAVEVGEYDEKLAALSDGESGTAPAAQIFGNLQLSERSSEIVLPTDTVFIFARATDGPPMPVAVLRRTVADLPLDFLLNDSQAMAADAKLSDVDEVIVTARISRSGVATEALQNLEAKSETINVAASQHVNLIIE